MGALPPLPADLTQLDEPRLVLALCHRDGRIRQEALRQTARAALDRVLSST
ncbi:hypothetical protein [Streptomyces sp. NPDC056628]|uniref:hypothetical protein n=1 Tax=Streptomyces sp. NPDC056628 TaxID=3345882 RepID=UPI0036B51528